MDSHSSSHTLKHESLVTNKVHTDGYLDSLRSQYNADMREPVVPVMVVLGIESILGIIGNSLVFYVFTNNYKRCNYKYLALALCMVDFAGCLITIPLDVVLRYYYYEIVGSVFCKIKLFFLMATELNETFILLLICIDRHRKVCHPSSWQLRHKTTLNLIAFITAVSIIGTGFMSGITAGEYFEEAVYRNVTIAVTQCGPDEQYKTSRISGLIIASELIVIVCVLITMIVLYVLVARKLYKYKKTENDKDKSQSSVRKSKLASARYKTIIAASLTFVFIVTFTLHCVSIHLLMSPSKEDQTKYKRALYTFLYTVYMVNYCINPIIYGCLDPQFAKVFSVWRTSSVVSSENNEQTPRS